MLSLYIFLFRLQIVENMVNGPRRNRSHYSVNLRCYGKTAKDRRDAKNYRDIGIRFYQLAAQLRAGLVCVDLLLDMIGIGPHILILNLKTLLSAASCDGDILTES